MQRNTAILFGIVLVLFFATFRNNHLAIQKKYREHYRSEFTPPVKNTSDKFKINFYRDNNHQMIVTSRSFYQSNSVRYEIEEGKSTDQNIDVNSTITVQTGLGGTSFSEQLPDQSKGVLLDTATMGETG